MSHLLIAPPFSCMSVFNLSHLQWWETFVNYNIYIKKYWIAFALSWQNTPGNTRGIYVAARLDMELERRAVLVCERTGYMLASTFENGDGKDGKRPGGCSCRNKALQNVSQDWLRKRYTNNSNNRRRQRGRVVRAPELKSGGHGFKSRSDHLAGVVSWRTLVQLLCHACK